MSDLSLQLTAPNGRIYIQPLGLFIANEWVKSSDGATLTSINPTYVTLGSLLSISSLPNLVPN
jgi:hypothetical protein